MRTFFSAFVSSNRSIVPGVTSSKASAFKDMEMEKAFFPTTITRSHHEQRVAGSDRVSNVETRFIVLSRH